MASLNLWLSTATASTGYTDSGGGTAYFAYSLLLGTTILNDTGPMATTTFQASSGLTGAAGTIVTMQQGTTNLVWVSEQLAGMGTSGFWQLANDFRKESVATANMGARFKVQLLSSGSTFIDNWIKAPLGEMSATGYTDQNTQGSAVGTTAISSGQRIAIVVQASSAGGAQGSGNVVFFAFGNKQNGSTGSAFITMNGGDGAFGVFSTFSGGSTVAPSTVTFQPPANTFRMMGVGVAPWAASTGTLWLT